MSDIDYTTVARTPLAQLHMIPLGMLVAYLERCCSPLVQHAIEEAIRRPARR